MKPLVEPNNSHLRTNSPPFFGDRVGLLGEAPATRPGDAAALLVRHAAGALKPTEEKHQTFFMV